MNNAAIIILIAAGSLIALWFAWQLVLWIFWILVSLTISLKKEYTKPNAFYNWVFVLWYRYMMVIGRLRLHVNGVENVPLDKKFLLVSNHRSKFDNFVQCAVLKKTQIAYISKPENFKIPIGRRFMRRGLYLAIARNNPKEALKTILKSIDYIKNNVVSVGIFPEGTRSKDGTLAEFKPGSFKIAEKTACPVVVVCMQGTEKISKNWPWKSTDVYMDVLTVLPPEIWKEKDTVKVAAEVQNMIQKKIEEKV